MIRFNISSKLIIIGLIFASFSGCGADGTVGPDTSTSTSSVGAVFCNNGAGASSGITVAWDVPTEYSDNSPLYFSDIDGLRIYFGTEPKRYNHIISINNPAMTSCSIPVSASDTYYIAMTVVTKDGRESDYSNEIVRSL